MANPRVEKSPERAAIAGAQAFRAVDGGTNPAINTVATPGSRHTIENGITGVAVPRRSRRRGGETSFGRPAGDAELTEASRTDIVTQLPPLPDPAERSTASSKSAKAGLTYLRGIADQVNRGMK